MMIQEMEEKDNDFRVRCSSTIDYVVHLKRQVSRHGVRLFCIISNFSYDEQLHSLRYYAQT